MAESQALLKQLQRQNTRIQRLLTPNLTQATGSDLFAGRKFRVAAREMRVLTSDNQPGSANREHISRLSAELTHRFQNPEQGLHNNSKPAPENKTWGGVERVFYGASMAQTKRETPAMPGVFRQGSIIPRMETFPKPGQSADDFHQRVQPALRSESVEVSPKKVVLAPRSRLYTKVEEISRSAPKPASLSVDEPDSLSVSLRSPPPTSPSQPVQRQVESVKLSSPSTTEKGSELSDALDSVLASKDKRVSLPSFEAEKQSRPETETTSSPSSVPSAVSRKAETHQPIQPKRNEPDASLPLARLSLPVVPGPLQRAQATQQSDTSKEESGLVSSVHAEVSDKGLFETKEFDSETPTLQAKVIQRQPAEPALAKPVQRQPAEIAPANLVQREASEPAHEVPVQRQPAEVGSANLVQREASESVQEAPVQRQPAEVPANFVQRLAKPVEQQSLESIQEKPIQRQPDELILAKPVQRQASEPVQAQAVQRQQTESVRAKPVQRRSSESALAKPVHSKPFELDRTVPESPLSARNVSVGAHSESGPAPSVQRALSNQSDEQQVVQNALPALREENLVDGLANRPAETPALVQPSRSEPQEPVIKDAAIEMPLLQAKLVQRQASEASQPENDDEETTIQTKSIQRKSVEVGKTPPPILPIQAKFTVAAKLQTVQAMPLATTNRVVSGLPRFIQRSIGLGDLFQKSGPVQRVESNSPSGQFVEQPGKIDQRLLSHQQPSISRSVDKLGVSADSGQSLRKMPLVHRIQSQGRVENVLKATDAGQLSLKTAPSLGLQRQPFASIQFAKYQPASIPDTAFALSDATALPGSSEMPLARVPEKSSPSAVVQRAVASSMSNLAEASPMGGDGSDTALSSALQGAIGESLQQEQAGAATKKPVDLNALAEEIFPIVKRLLAIEADRFGGSFQ